MSSFDRRTASIATLGFFTARILGFDPYGAALVAAIDADPATARPARSVIPIGPDMLGAEVVIGFDGGDRDAPLILGAIQPHGALPHRIGLTAAGSIEIACGRSSIVLHADGKILIRGDYVISRARRTNRLEGGAVQIN